VRYDLSLLCASNLTFVRSVDAQGVTYKLANKCWEVHRFIISIVKPKIIITIGNGEQKSAYTYLHKISSKVREDNPLKAFHGEYKIKSFIGKFDELNILVVGLPHLSRYDVTGDAKHEARIRIKLKIDMFLK